MRKLCTIQTISSMDDIEGKDRIKLASFDSVGWRVITTTDMKPGDTVVYCETDTILPVKPEFEFLRKRCYNEIWNGFRIKRMKMGGVLSEGIVFPLSILGDTNKFKHSIDNTDVTHIIGAIKYDPEALEEEKSNTREKRYPWWMRLLFRIPFMKKLLLPARTRSWPKFMSKTDETRVQNLIHILQNSGWKGMPIYATEKLDGQSASFGADKNFFYVCSRNMCVFKGNIHKRKVRTMMDSRYIQTALKYDIQHILRDYKRRTNKYIYIQGEQMGPGIQKNKYDLKEIKFYIFNIRECDTGRYFSMKEIMDFCGHYGLAHVPIVYMDRFQWDTVDSLLELSKGRSALADIPREGIVIRPITPLPPEREMSNMWSFKVINPEFLMKYGMEE